MTRHSRGRFRIERNSEIESCMPWLVERPRKKSTRTLDDTLKIVRRARLAKGIRKAAPSRSFATPLRQAA